MYSGFDLHNQQTEIIKTIETKQKQELLVVSNFFNNPTVLLAALDVLEDIPTFATKKPSPLMPLGVGQSEQYGYYKSINNWSSTYDNDMVEELANPERLVNGNIDFSFLVIFLLPILMIIMTYNIRGLEQDLKGYENFTLLIPDDEVFAAIDPVLQNKIFSDNELALKIISNHIKKIKLRFKNIKCFFTVY